MVIIVYPYRYYNDVMVHIINQISEFIIILLIKLELQVFVRKNNVV